MKNNLLALVSRELLIHAIKQVFFFFHASENFLLLCNLVVLIRCCNSRWVPSRSRWLLYYQRNWEGKFLSVFMVKFKELCYYYFFCTYPVVLIWLFVFLSLLMYEKDVLLIYFYVFLGDFDTRATFEKSCYHWYW